MNNKHIIYFLIISITIILLGVNLIQSVIVNECCYVESTGECVSQTTGCSSYKSIGGSPTTCTGVTKCEKSCCCHPDGGVTEDITIYACEEKGTGYTATAAVSGETCAVTCEANECTFIEKSEAVCNSCSTTATPYKYITSGESSDTAFGSYPTYTSGTAPQKCCGDQTNSEYIKCNSDNSDCICCNSDYDAYDTGKCNPCLGTGKSGVHPNPAGVGDTIVFDICLK